MAKVLHCHAWYTTTKGMQISLVVIRPSWDKAVYFCSLTSRCIVENKSDMTNPHLIFCDRVRPSYCVCEFGEVYNITLSLTLSDLYVLVGHHSALWPANPMRLRGRSIISTETRTNLDTLNIYKSDLKVDIDTYRNQADLGVIRLCLTTDPIRSIIGSLVKSTWDVRVSVE